MAGVTILGCTREHIVDVALGTFGVGVRASQRECGEAVVKGGRLPGRGRVTRRAAGPILAAMTIIFGMAGIAVRRRSLEFKISMALAANHVYMFACQLEN